MRLKRMLIAVSAGTAAAVLMAASPAQAASVTDLNSLIESHSSTYVPLGFLPVHTLSISAEESAAVPVGTPKVVTGTPYYLGCATLVNHTSITQTMKSNSFRRDYTNTVSTTVTTGVSTTNKVSGSFKLSEVANVGVEQSVTISYQNANTQTSAVRETHTAPSQAVTVPAGQTRYVVASLTPTTYSGTLALNTSLSGPFLGEPRLNPNNVQFLDLYNYFVTTTGKGATLPTGFSLNSSTRTLDFKGTGTYTMVAGVNFTARVMEKLPSGMSPGSCVA
ncbi:epsilon-toxin family protein [Salinispora arenicola]|uniref:epsilon-toxin family protein n=1 Tax=Salinispora arenicola TaxID=168697 RepID=UPI0009B7C17C|nr:epsilon-toxin family protein [Salinispora arenicola]